MDEKLREKEKWQDEYEKKVENAVEELFSVATDRGKTQIKEKVEGIVNEVENIAFMNGYKYAIAVLEEGLMNMGS